MLLYASLKYVIHLPPGCSVFISYDTLETDAKAKEAEFIEKGYDTFIYRTYATSAGKLNERFISYPAAAKSFIIMHEFVHNYIAKLKLPIPYDFNEALADVIGNYGTLQFLEAVGSDKLDSARAQTTRTEQLYKIMNGYIDKINSKQNGADKFSLKCEKKIKEVLIKADLFQKDRFDYHVNNAYLLKNKNYSYNYFLLKKVFRKQKSLGNVLRILKNAPTDAKNFRKYIVQYS